MLLRVRYDGGDGGGFAMVFVLFILCCMLIFVYLLFYLYKVIMKALDVQNGFG